MTSNGKKILLSFILLCINLTANATKEYKIKYGENELQFGYLRVPKKHVPHPVAIIIHGGCWVSAYATLQNTEALAEALRNLGIATWNIEYRGEDVDGGGFPGTFLDVANATDFLKKIAKKYSLDLNNVITIGHSAGGHLALWDAARQKLTSESALYLKDPLKIKGSIILGGIPDLKAFREQAKITCESDVVGKLLGNTPDEINKNMKDASPAELLPLGVPHIFIYGSDDTAVPVKFGYDYMQYANTTSDNIALIMINHAPHQDYIMPDSTSWPQVSQSALLLLGKIKK